jgi:NADPH:quinone reductase-like Zn-dependent oxidoreductase
MEQATHHRVVVPRRGGPEVLQVVEEELPQPRAGEVRVKLLAAGVSAYDLMVRSGRFPGFPRVPFTPGVDIVGVVDKLGEGWQPSSRGSGLRVGLPLPVAATRSSSAGPPAGWCPSPRAWILPRPSAW